MFKTFGQVIDKAKELEETIVDIDHSLEKLRGKDFLTDIDKDARPTIVVLYNLRTITINDLASLKSTVIGGDK